MLDTERHKQKIMEVLAFTQQFLKQHNLRYFACAGTALGAVRHQGIIPWDDDVDLTMPRSDYDRLIALRSQMEGSGFALFSPDNDGYNYSFAKVVDTRTTLWEYDYMPFLLGVYVDIFPLDFTDAEPDVAVVRQGAVYRALSRYTKSNRIYDFGALVRRFFHGDVRTAVTGVRYAVGRGCRKRKYEAQYRKALSAFHPQQGRYCVSVTILLWLGLVFDSEWFAESIEMPFGDQKIPVPKGYDAYLTALYGDYMTPPPPDKRITHHDVYFADLDHRYSISELRHHLPGTFE